MADWKWLRRLLARHRILAQISVSHLKIHLARERLLAELAKSKRVEQEIKSGATANSIAAQSNEGSSVSRFVRTLNPDKSGEPQ